MTTHTPGPWAVSFCGNSITIDGQGQESTDHICDLPGGCSDEYTKRNSPEHYDPDDAIVQANARLIAAAPETAAERDKLKAINAELLTALKGLMAELDAEWQSRGFANRKDEARDAIAKAQSA